MSDRIVVVGASAGGVEALTTLARALPEDLGVPVLVVLHVPPSGTSVLPTILQRAGPLPAKHAEDEEPLEAGTIYVAPPDHHLTVEDTMVRVGRGPKENGHRPAIDPLFRTTARAYGPRAIGVVLSGVLDDGSAGLRALRARGGTAVVQDPGDALYATMPAKAIEYADPDYVLPVSEIAGMLDELARRPVLTPANSGDGDVAEDDLVFEEILADERERPPSGLTCPECSGALWEVTSSGPLRYRCRVGHAYTEDSLAAEQGEALEAALWTALRSLEERAVLTKRLAGRAEDEGRRRTSSFFRERALEAEAHAAVVRQALTSMATAAPPPDEPREAA